MQKSFFLPPKNELDGEATGWLWAQIECIRSIRGQLFHIFNASVKPALSRRLQGVCRGMNFAIERHTGGLSQARFILYKEKLYASLSLGRMHIYSYCSKWL